MTGLKTLKEIKVREAEGSDYGALRNFRAGDLWYQREVTKLVKRLARILRDEPTEEHFTASAYLNEDGEIVAVTAFDRHDDETAELLLLALDSPFQGSVLSEDRGKTSHQVLGNTLEQMRSQGYERAFLEVALENAAAQRLYGEFGFLEGSVLKGGDYRVMAVNL